MGVRGLPTNLVSDKQAPWRVGAMFAVAACLPVLFVQIGVPLIGILGGFVGSTLRHPFALLVAVSGAGGQWVGGRLWHGLKSRLVFGAAFASALAGPLLAVAGLESFSAYETVPRLSLGFVPVFAVPYSFLGLVSAALSGASLPRTFQLMGRFGVGGMFGGLVLAVVVVGTGEQSGVLAGTLRAVGPGIACGLPAAIGGSALAKLSVA